MVAVPPIRAVAERAALFERYQQGYQAVLDALAGSPTPNWTRARRPGDWTAREVVHHLADSEMTSAIRLRRLLVEDNPLIDGYDEMAFARVLRYAERPIQPALEALAAARGTTAQLFEHMTDADWARPAPTPKAAPTRPPTGSTSTPPTPTTTPRRSRAAFSLRAAVRPQATRTDRQWPGGMPSGSSCSEIHV